MYDPRFKFQPYIGDNTYLNHANDLLDIQAKIHDKLGECENFLGVDFCDVHAGGIQVRGHHKLIERYSYPGVQPTIEYDFSNSDEVVNKFIEAWNEADNEKDVQSFLRFVREGEKYGWD
ncbi:MAG: hypothetical protein IJJ25_00210 [Lachnospiraceae bacterium]|nr:hypothetical protein [Lachnospiraceae bacterium]MBQ6482746.1 hypothetical protein [Anaerolineaceae bacterium]